MIGDRPAESQLDTLKEDVRQSLLIFRIRSKILSLCEESCRDGLIPNGQHTSFYLKNPVKVCVALLYVFCHQIFSIEYLKSFLFINAVSLVFISDQRFLKNVFALWSMSSLINTHMCILAVQIVEFNYKARLFSCILNPELYI